jgi:hypothetical protein
MMRKNYSLILLCCLAIIGSAQGQNDTHAIHWIKYQNQLNFSPKLYWSNEIDNRRFINPDAQNQLIFHSRLHYKKGRWDYAGGLTLSWAYATFAEKPIKHPTLEARPVIEAGYEIPCRGFSLQQRIRIDNRFFEADKYETIFDGSTYVMRMRYRLQARIPMRKDTEGNPRTTLRIADEIMFNHRENLFDQNRIYFSSDWVVTKHWSVELGYVYIYQQRFGTEQFLQRHVLRFSLSHKLFFY